MNQNSLTTHTHIQIATKPSRSIAPKSLTYEAGFLNGHTHIQDCHKTFTLNCSKISQTMKQNSLIHIPTYRLRENLHSNLLQILEQLWSRIPENTFPHTDCHITLTLQYCSEISPGLLRAVSLPVSWSCLHSKLHTQSSHLNISAHYLLA